VSILPEPAALVSELSPPLLAQPPARFTAPAGHFLAFPGRGSGSDRSVSSPRSPQAAVGQVLASDRHHLSGHEEHFRVQVWQVIDLHTTFNEPLQAAQ
jgi:hypothetical protein